jgi:hypothetical protein
LQRITYAMKQELAKPRINVSRLATIFLGVLVLPTAIAVAIDMLFSLFPLVTIIAIVLVFPAATIIINRMTLREFDRVIELVAPEPVPAADGTAEPQKSHQK